jgi:plastocyanin
MSRRMHRLAVGLLALAAGVGAAVALPAFAPGDAPPSTASFTAQDYAWHVTGGSATSVTIAVGGTVAFAYPSGASTHNADFSGTAPSSCTQTAGAGSGSVPPLPAYPTAPGWTGSCRFDTPGTYSFHCDAHQTMHGTIEVVDPNATAPSTAPPTTTSGDSSSGSGSGTSTTSGPTREFPSVRVPHVQVGAVLHGRATAPAAGWRWTIAAFASSRSLSAHPPKHARQVRIGSVRLHATHAGTVSFELALSRAARAALHRHHRLALSLKISATFAAPGEASATEQQLSVVVRERSGRS